jgi:hypothetical protein
MFTNNKASPMRRMRSLAVGSAISLSAIIAFPVAGLTQQPSPILVAQNRAIEASSAQEETLYLNNDRTYAYNLVAARAGTIDGVSFPAGATIVGRYEPAKGGLRYVANTVVYGDRSYRIRAVSETIEDEKDPRDTSIGAIAEDAGIGAAAGVVVGEIFGDADVGEIVGGAAAGGIVGNVTADRVVVIKPEKPIILYSN